MRNSVSIWLILASLSMNLSGCYSEPEVRNHLVTGDEGPLQTLPEDESLFLEVRGNQYERGDTGTGLESTNVFVELAQNGVIYSKRYRVSWAGEDVPQIEIQNLDRKQLSEKAHENLRERLFAYLPASESKRDTPLTPKSCPIAVGGVSPAIISVGQKFENADARFVFPSGCESSSGAVVREDLNSILESLPPLEGIGDTKIS